MIIASNLQFYPSKKILKLKEILTKDAEWFRLFSLSNSYGISNYCIHSRNGKLILLLTFLKIKETLHLLLIKREEFTLHCSQTPPLKYGWGKETTAFTLSQAMHMVSMSRVPQCTSLMSDARKERFQNNVYCIFM